MNKSKQGSKYPDSGEKISIRPARRNQQASTRRVIASGTMDKSGNNPSRKQFRKKSSASIPDDGRSLSAPAGKTMHKSMDLHKQTAFTSSKGKKTFEQQQQRRNQE